MPPRRVQQSTVEELVTVEACQAQELQGQVDAATQRSRVDNQPPTTKSTYKKPQTMWKVSPLALP